MTTFSAYCCKQKLKQLKLYSLLQGTYQVEVSQLQMVIAGYYTIMNMLLHNSYIIYGKSDPHVVYLHELLWQPACVHVMKRPSSEEWHIAISQWFIVDACCVVNLVSVGIYCHALNSNQLVQLRGCLWSFYTN